VLSVAVPAPVSAIGLRLAGWGLAAGVGLLAVMLIWPPRERATLRADTARSCLGVAAVADSLCGDGPAEAASLAAAGESIKALRGRLTATPHRPTGPTRSTAALAGIIDELGWLYQSLEIMARSPEGELCVAENTAAIRAVATVLRASAGELDGRPDLSDRDQAGKQPVQRLERARETAAQMLARRVAEQPQIPDEQALQAQVDRGFRVYTISYTARQIAGYARAASPQPDGPPIEGVPGPAELAAAARVPVPEPGPDPLTGVLPASGRWPSWMRSLLDAVEGFTTTHADYRSIWFRNSVRGAVGLAIAVFIAQKPVSSTPSVVLGTLSVLRSNALGTGRSVISAGRDGGGHRHRGRDPDPAEGRRDRAVGDPPGRGAAGGVRTPGHLVRRGPGRVHRGRPGPVQHHPAHRLEGGDPADRGRGGRLRDQPGGGPGVLAPGRGRAVWQNLPRPTRGLLTTWPPW
jgi:hypothetical protein